MSKFNTVSNEKIDGRFFGYKLIFHQLRKLSHGSFITRMMEKYQERQAWKNKQNETHYESYRWLAIKINRTGSFSIVSFFYFIFDKWTYGERVY